MRHEPFGVSFVNTKGGFLHGKPNVIHIVRLMDKNCILGRIRKRKMFPIPSCEIIERKNKQKMNSYDTQENFGDSFLIFIVSDIEESNCFRHGSFED